MSQARARFRDVISKLTCTVAANIFDPLSARIAQMLDYEVCFLSGSVGKVANLGVPDIVMYNMSDAVDHCRRITRMADVSLMVDGEEGFGNAVNVMRTVKELRPPAFRPSRSKTKSPPSDSMLKTPACSPKRSRWVSWRRRWPRAPIPQPSS